jgi:hypothetical protein
VVSAISLFSCYLFITFHQSPPEKKIDKISAFKITKISGRGKVYYDKRQIETDSFSTSTAKTLNMKQMKFDEEMYIKSDSYTSFQFYCFEMSFIVLPDSYLYYRPQTKEFSFFKGEFYWKKESKSNKVVEISVREPQYLMTLSDSGRIRISGNNIEVWNYSGSLKLNFAEKDYTLNPSQALVAFTAQGNRKQRPPVISEILPFPRQIDPADKVIALKTPQASVVKFDWRVVRGNPSYRFKLYSSDLRENLLLERLVAGSDVTLDLLQFEEREFFWEVTPIDNRYQREGVPSKLGHIKMVGSLLEKKNVQKPPDLNIKSLTVNGNLVIIKGNADTNAKLYINDESISLDRDGEFIHTLSFTSIGVKKIICRLVSPLGVETVEEQKVTIYAE